MTTAPVTPLIGLIGRKRAGKDTFAAVLTTEYGFHRLAFADPLRAAALRLDPIVGRPALPSDLGGQLVPSHDVRLSEVIEMIGWERAKDYVPEVRGILQRLGTDAIRTIDQDFWLRAATVPIDARTVPVIVTDCRFPNEAEAIAERGGVIVRIVRPGVTDDDPHPTETALDDYPEDIVVYNEGDVADLEASARGVAGAIIRYHQYKS